MNEAAKARVEAAKELRTTTEQRSEMAGRRTAPEGAQPAINTLRSQRAEAEIDAISHALELTGWNRRRAAQLLSISYRGLLYKIRLYNISPESRMRLVPFVQRVKV